MRAGRGKVTSDPVGQHLPDNPAGQTSIDPAAGNRGHRRHFQMQQGTQEHHGRQTAAGVSDSHSERDRREATRAEQSEKNGKEVGGAADHEKTSGRRQRAHRPDHVFGLIAGCSGCRNRFGVAGNERHQTEQDQETGCDQENPDHFALHMRGTGRG
jgi:hypothetical protein